MEYATTYDVGDRKRDRGINEDSVAITVFEQGHRDGFRGQVRPVARDETGGDGARVSDETERTERSNSPPSGRDDAVAGDGDSPVDVGESARAGGGDVARGTDAARTDSETRPDRGTRPDSETRQGAEMQQDAEMRQDAGGGEADVSASDDAAPANRSVAVFALADGAGGYEAGDAASYLATTAVCEELASVAVRAARNDPTAFDIDVEEPLGHVPSAADLESAVAAAIVTAHREIVEYAATSGKQAHTTIVAGLAVGGRLHYGWVGDSRAYLVNERHGAITQITRDHAVVEALSDAGEVDDVEARVHPRGNEITRALGGDGRADPETATVDVDTATVDLYAEDVVLLTSDGLVDAQTDAPTLYDRYVRADRDDAVGERVRDRIVTDEEIRDRVLAADSLDRAASDLLGLANERGGKDNVSTLLFRDRTLDPTPGSPPDRSVGSATPVEERHTILGSDE